MEMHQVCSNGQEAVFAAYIPAGLGVLYAKSTTNKIEAAKVISQTRALEFMRTNCGYKNFLARSSLRDYRTLNNFLFGARQVIERIQQGDHWYREDQNINAAMDGFLRAALTMGVEIDHEAPDQIRAKLIAEFHTLKKESVQKK